MICRAGKNLGFLEKVFRFFSVFLDFSVDTKFPPIRKNILYTILSGRAFSVKYNKTHKSRIHD